MARIERILIATDFSDEGHAALDRAAELAAQLDASLIVVHVYLPPTLLLPDGLVGGTPAERLPVRDELGHALERAAAHAIALGAPRAETRMADGEPWREIVRVARDEAVDLIVVGTSGRGALAHALVGSVAEKVVRKAPCPVLTVKASAAAHEPSSAGELDSRAGHA